MRKVRTASGAVAVQLMRKSGRRDVVVEHVGSAHTDAELGVLLERARRIATGDQDVLEFEVSARTARVADVADWRTGPLSLPADAPKGAPVAPGRTAATSSRLLYDVIGGIYVAKYHDLWKVERSSACPRPIFRPGPCSTAPARRSKPT